MSLDTKKRILRIVLVIFAIWPIVQFTLTETADLSAWKLFGWGMYATPQRNVRARIFEIRSGLPIEFDQTRLSKKLMRRFEKFQVDRIALGNLLRPDKIGDEVLAEIPGIEGALIVVETKSIDARTALVRTDRKNYPYFRPDQPKSSS